MSYGIFNYENDEVGTCMMLIYDLDEQSTQQQPPSSSQQSQMMPKTQQNNTLIRPNSSKNESDFSMKFFKPPDSEMNLRKQQQQYQRPMTGMSAQYGKKNNESTFQNGGIFGSANGSISQQQNTANSFMPGQQSFVNQSPNTFFSSTKNSQQQQQVDNGTVQYANFSRMMNNLDEETLKVYMQQFQQEQMNSKPKQSFQ